MLGSLVGRSVGNYVVKELLGSGGMGEVYLAEHPRIGRRVAIKVLAHHYAAQPQASDRFEAEARIISRIDHPNIVSIFDFGTLDDGSLYYVMELLQGRELSDLLESQGKFTPAEAFPLVAQICRGLHAAHSRGVIHRDLKPDNIFVLNEPPSAVKILDFGIAKLLENDPQNVSVTATGTVMGTPLVISPEQASGRINLIGPQTDIYSLGVIVYWLLGGKPPFFDSIPSVLLAMHITQPPPSLQQHEPSVPPPLVELVQQCLEKEPQRRPQSAQEVGTRFARAIGAPPESITGSNVVLSLPTGPIVPSPDGLSTGMATTIASTVGEMARPAGAGRRFAFWLATLVLAISLGVTAFVVVLGRREQAPEKRPGGKPVTFAVKGPQRPETLPSHTVMVTTGSLPSTCALALGGSEVQKMTGPCRFSVTRGQNARLTVSSEGLDPFMKEWKVVSNLSLALVADRRTGRLALPVKPGPAADAQSSAAGGALAGEAPVVGGRARRHKARRKVRVKETKVAEPVPTVTTKEQPPPPPAKTKRRIGERTLEVDL